MTNSVAGRGSDGLLQVLDDANGFQGARHDLSRTDAVGGSRVTEAALLSGPVRLSLLQLSATSEQKTAVRSE